MELGGEGLNCMEQEGEELDHTGRESLTAWNQKGWSWTTCIERGGGWHMLLKREGLSCMKQGLAGDK